MKTTSEQLLAEVANDFSQYLMKGEFMDIGSFTEKIEPNLNIDNIEKLATGFGLEAHQLFLFSQAGESPAEPVPEAKLRDLLEHAEPEQKALMWRVLREIRGA